MLRKLLTYFMRVWKCVFKEDDNYSPVEIYTKILLPRYVFSKKWTAKLKLARSLNILRQSTKVSPTSHGANLHLFHWTISISHTHPRHLRVMLDIYTVTTRPWQKTFFRRRKNRSLKNFHRFVYPYMLLRCKVVMMILSFLVTHSFLFFLANTDDNDFCNANKLQKKMCEEKSEKKRILFSLHLSQDTITKWQREIFVPASVKITHHSFFSQETFSSLFAIFALNNEVIFWQVGVIITFIITIYFLTRTLFIIIITWLTSCYVFCGFAWEGNFFYSESCKWEEGWLKICKATGDETTDRMTDEWT